MASGYTWNVAMATSGVADTDDLAGADTVAGHGGGDGSDRRVSATCAGSALWVVWWAVAGR
jgi:hypothetical protein